MSNSLYTKIAYWCWPILSIVWLLGYFKIKRTLRRPELGRYIYTSLLLAAGFIFLFGRHYSSLLQAALTPRSAFLGITGDVLCIIGIAFAIWARISLGSNWSGATATLKEQHELITTGPYKIVRHPIYTGFLFAMFGTALTLGTVAGYFGVFLGLIGFLLRIPTEERLMLREFPEAYTDYKKRVKMIIPFLI